MVPEPTLLEAETREAIDNKLEAAGWVIQYKNGGDRVNTHTMKRFPKALIFAKDDVHGRKSVASARAHRRAKVEQCRSNCRGRSGATDDYCDRIVDAVCEVFDEGNAFCKKITYIIGKPEQNITCRI